MSAHLSLCKGCRYTKYVANVAYAILTTNTVFATNAAFVANAAFVVFTLMLEPPDAVKAFAEGKVVVIKRMGVLGTVSRRPQLFISLSLVTICLYLGDFGNMLTFPWTVLSSRASKQRSFSSTLQESFPVVELPSSSAFQ